MDEKHEEAAVGRRRKSYDEAFKRAAVRLATEETSWFAAAAQAVGVSEQRLRIWHEKLAPTAPPCDDSASVEELRDTMARLRKQLCPASVGSGILLDRR